MDRFHYDTVSLHPNEEIVIRVQQTKLYDGNHKTSFEGGDVILTYHRLIWARPDEIVQNGQGLALHLSYVLTMEEEYPSAFSFSGSHKIVLHVLPVPEGGRRPGPMEISLNTYIKISLKGEGARAFSRHLQEVISRRHWLVQPLTSHSAPKQPPPIKPRVGIIGIERGLQEKQKETNQNISEAFKDLNKLMTMAKDMVSLAKNISNKIRDKQGNITEDETIQFKSYLLSLGIDDPVTRDSSSSESQYMENLARQIVTILEKPITEQGGMMSLAEAYCRVNRARGLELVSAEDLLGSCMKLGSLGLPLELRRFDSGTAVLQHTTHSDHVMVCRITELLDIHGWLTAEIFAQELGISVILAREHLITSEKLGNTCRDESIEGLKFYPNLFLKNNE